MHRSIYPSLHGSLKVPHQSASCYYRERLAFLKYIFIYKLANDDAIHSSTTMEAGGSVYVYLAKIFTFKSLPELHILDYFLGKTFWWFYIFHLWLKDIGFMSFFPSRMPVLSFLLIFQHSSELTDQVIRERREENSPLTKSEEEFPKNVFDRRSQQSAGSLVMCAHVTGTLAFVDSLKTSWCWKRRLLDGWWENQSWGLSREFTRGTSFQTQLTVIFGPVNTPNCNLVKKCTHVCF